MSAGPKSIQQIFQALGVQATSVQAGGLAVTSPGSGEVIAALPTDNAKTVDQKIALARHAQPEWSQLTRGQREALLEAYSAALKAHREQIAGLIVSEGGKTGKEALGETDSSAEVILKTMRDAVLPEFSGMLRVKERPPVGAVGLITSFNFPLVVAHWTLAPALLAGNAVIWKPSEKTPLTALAAKAVFDKTMGKYADLLQVVIGGRETGEALVANEQVDMISATGSVAMGEGIKARLAKKKNNAIRPILELGGNNGVIISSKVSREHLDWSLAALLNSFLGTSGQRCTNTRRLIVHQSLYDQAVQLLKNKLEAFLATSPLQNPANEYGYGPLIDEDAFRRFEQAREKAVTEGGKMLLGKRLLADTSPHAYFVEPALALMPAQTPVMHHETFAPLLFIVPYGGDIDQAIDMLNAPDNAGLVSAIYTQSQEEVDRFAAGSQAGHVLINPPKGTGTPAHNMGFGGNKASGCGEILNAADPLRPFTREDHFRRIAQNKAIAMTES
jgi:aldehyde dehydrogenase (NAD+)